jgi:methylthioribose-1-phosphate isomerase
VANKIGTYQLALLARAHGVPFYVAAPLSTIDMQTKCGEDISIEHRGEEEVTHIGGQRIAAEGVEVLNPAFDITPHQYISAIFTEKGAVRPPFDQGLKRLFPTDQVQGQL